MRAATKSVTDASVQACLAELTSAALSTTIVESLTPVEEAIANAEKQAKADVESTRPKNQAELIKREKCLSQLKRTAAEIKKLNSNIKDRFDRF